VEVTADLLRVDDSNISRQARVQCPGQGRNRELRSGLEADDLTGRVDPGVRSSGPGDPSLTSGDPLDGFFDGFLNGSATRLRLKPAEFGTIVGQGQADRAHSRRVLEPARLFDQLNHRHLGSIAESLAEADDPGVSTRAFQKSRAQHIKQLLNDFCIEKLSGGQPAMVNAVALPESQNLFGHRLDGPSLGQGRC
jgi:hypothetical protein